MARVQSLVEELRSCKPHGMAPPTQKKIFYRDSHWRGPRMGRAGPGCGEDWSVWDWIAEAEKGVTIHHLLPLPSCFLHCFCSFVLVQPALMVLAMLIRVRDLEMRPCPQGVYSPLVHSFVHSFSRSLLGTSCPRPWGYSDGHTGVTHGSLVLAGQHGGLAGEHRRGRTWVSFPRSFSTSLSSALSSLFLFVFTRSFSPASDTLWALSGPPVDPQNQCSDPCQH